jgi:hypothetical protein
MNILIAEAFALRDDPPPSNALGNLALPRPPPPFGNAVDDGGGGRQQKSVPLHVHSIKPSPPPAAEVRRRTCSSEASSNMTFTTLQKRSTNHCCRRRIPPPGIIVDRTPHGQHGGIPAQDPEEDALAEGCTHPRPFLSDSPTTKANTASLPAYLTISLARKDSQV